MDKKEIIKKCLLGFAVILIIAVIVIALCCKKDNNFVKPTSKPINEGVSLETVFGVIAKIDGIEQQTSQDTIEKTDVDARKWSDEEEIDFGKFDVLEKKAIVNTTDSSVNEVWMIKLGDYNQQEDVCRILGNRVKKLKAGFEGNSSQTEILDKAVIKQEDGIVIMIVSEHVNEIEKAIADEMAK